MTKHFQVPGVCVFFRSCGKQMSLIDQSVDKFPRGVLLFAFVEGANFAKGVSAESPVKTGEVRLRPGT